MAKIPGSIIVISQGLPEILIKAHITFTIPNFFILNLLPVILCGDPIPSQLAQFKEGLHLCKTIFQQYSSHYKQKLGNSLRFNLPFGPILARRECNSTINSSFGGGSLLAFTSNCNKICVPPRETRKPVLRLLPRNKIWAVGRNLKINSFYKGIIFLHDHCKFM